MEESILKSTKKILGLAADYTAFDQDVITHINAAFSILNQLGIGVDGFTIEDDTTNWSTYSSDGLVLHVPDNQMGLIKTYIYLKVRILFDPPATSFFLSAAENQVKEYEWRLNNMREVDKAANIPSPIIPDFGVGDDTPIVPRRTLNPPFNASVVPFNDGESHITISWGHTPDVEFVLIYFKVVGAVDFDINAWGIEQLSVIQNSEIGVDYEYYLESRADGYDPVESEHFFVTGI